MSATPRTDSMAKPAKQYVCECVPARFARQLEMENGELRGLLARWVEYCIPTSQRTRDLWDQSKAFLEKGKA